MSRAGKTAALATLLAPGLLAAAGPPSDLTEVVDRAMGGRQGCAVVLDVPSGRLLALHGADVAARRLVPPGSTLKPFALLALLQSGAVGADTRLLCRHDLRIAGRRLDCSHPMPGEPLDPAAALAYSCNFYFAHFAAALTDDDLPRAFARAGLDSRTGLVPGEATGVIRRVRGTAERQLQALGEALIEVTPLGVAGAYRRLALLQSAGGPQRDRLAPLFVGLEASVSSGTGRLAAPEGVVAAGKTGTAGAAEGPWSHAWFAGWAPAGKPKTVVVIFLERGHGGSDAAPVAREIFSAVVSTKGPS